METIEFGGYDWRVLDKQDGKTLLIMDMALNSWKTTCGFAPPCG